MIRGKDLEELAKFRLTIQDSEFLESITNKSFLTETAKFNEDNKSKLNKLEGEENNK